MSHVPSSSYVPRHTKVGDGIPARLCGSWFSAACPASTGRWGLLEPWHDVFQCDDATERGMDGDEDFCSKLATLPLETMMGCCPAALC